MFCIGLDVAGTRVARYHIGCQAQSFLFSDALSPPNLFVTIVIAVVFSQSLIATLRIENI